MFGGFPKVEDDDPMDIDPRGVLKPVTLHVDFKDGSLIGRCISRQKDFGEIFNHLDVS
jgi:hypothetical protein